MAVPAGPPRPRLNLVWPVLGRPTEGIAPANARLAFPVACGDSPDGPKVEFPWTFKESANAADFLSRGYRASAPEIRRA
jgi:hypothetical protein